MKGLCLFGLWSALTFSFTSAQSSRYLPQFTKVKVRKDYASTVFTVSYKANEIPNIQWFVDGFPVPVSHHDYHVITDHVSKFSILSTTVAAKEDVSVCLQLKMGKTCMDMTPQTHNVVEQDVDYPWPTLQSVVQMSTGFTLSNLEVLYGASPLIFYSNGELSVIIIDRHRGLYTRTDSAVFIGKDFENPATPLREVESTGAEGEGRGDLVFIKPVEGYENRLELRLRTEAEKVEGVFMIQADYTPKGSNPNAGLIKSVTNTRPIKIIRLPHMTPFPEGYLSKLPQRDYQLPWSCRDGFDCLVTCPFVSNGAVNVTISRVVSGPVVEAGPLDVSSEVVWLGEFYGEVRFVVPDFKAAMTHDRTFRVDVQNAKDSDIFLVKV